MAHSLSNFNIYEVLEPLKCPPNENNVGILIDINDETDSICKDLSGSDLDSIKKSEFDLVDLYQNIYVTPQLVKKPAGKTDANIDFSDLFLQTHESKEETDVLKKNNTVIALSEADIEELLKRPDDITKESCSVLHEEFTINSDNAGTKSNWIKSGSVLEDRSIDNIQKSLETSNEERVINHKVDLREWVKSCYDERKELNYNDIQELFNRSRKAKDDDLSNSGGKSKLSEEIRAKLEWIKGQSELKEALINELLRIDPPIKSNETTSLHTGFPNYNITKVLKVPNDEKFKTGNITQKRNDIPTTSKKEVISKFNMNKDSDLDRDSENRKEYKHNTAKETPESLYPIHFALQTDSTVNIHNITHKQNVNLLQTAKLDKKLYAKRHIHSNLQKIGFTKGPTLYEKSVVLPQIMERLALRNEAIHQEAHLPRRLILDSGIRTKQACDNCKCLQKSNTPSVSNTVLKQSKNTLKQTVDAVPLLAFLHLVRLNKNL